MTALASRFHSLSQELSLLGSKRKIIRYIGWADRSNLGDWAVELALEKLFRPRARLYTKAYDGRLLQRKMDRGWRPDGVMLGGGTLVKRPTSTFGRFMEADGRMKFVFGSGVSDPSFWAARFPESHENLDRCAAYLRDHVPFIGLRGPLSQTLLTERGVQNVRVVGDPAFLLARPTLQSKPGAKILGVNVGLTSDGCWGGSDAAVWKNIAAALRVLIARGWQPVFLPVWPDDYDVNRRLAQELARDSARPWPVRIARTPEEFVRFTDQIDVMLGEKLHSVAMALCTYTPSVMIEYRPKCRDLMASLGLEPFVFRSDRLIPDEIADRIEEVWSASASHRQNLFSKIAQINSGLEQAADEVMARMDKESR